MRVILVYLNIWASLNDYLHSPRTIVSSPNFLCGRTIRWPAVLGFLGGSLSLSPSHPLASQQFNGNVLGLSFNFLLCVNLLVRYFQ